MMKKISKVFIALLLLVSMTLAPFSAMAATYYGVINANSVKMCSGPSSTKYEVVKLLNKGTAVAYSSKKYGDRHGYCKVMLKNGKTGYVAAMYITGKGKTSSKSVYTVTKSTKYYNSKKKAMGYFARGTKLMLVQKKGKWAKVKTLKGNIYYMPAANLKKG